MAYTNLQLLRIEIADPFKYAFDSQTGDGETTKFKLSHDKVQDATFKVYVNDIESVEGDDFTIDLDQGMITFTSAPEDEKSVEIAYYFAVFSDDELNAFLVLDDNNITATALRCVDILLFDSSRNFDYKAGDASLSPSQVFSNLEKLRSILKGKLDTASHQPIIVKRSSKYYKAESPRYNDLSRLKNE